MTFEQIAELKFYSNDLGKKVAIRQFMFELFKALWIEKEGFDSKRPFGNSGWDGDLIVCLIKNNLISGKLNFDFYIESYDKKQADKFIMNKIIKPLFGIK